LKRICAQTTLDFARYLVPDPVANFAHRMYLFTPLIASRNIFPVPPLRNRPDSI
jgi:hypothetical protein